MKLFIRIPVVLALASALWPTLSASSASIFQLNQSAYVAPAGTDVSVPVFLGTSGSLSTNLIGGLAVRVSTLGANGGRIDSVTGNGDFLPGSADSTPALDVGVSELADIFASPFGVPLAGDGTILIGTFLVRAPLTPGTVDTFNVLHFDQSPMPGLFNFLADFTDIEPPNQLTFTVRATGTQNIVPLPAALWMGASVLGALAAARRRGCLRHGSGGWRLWDWRRKVRGQ